jgi:transcriptional regulator with XRE-family HTH domain
MTELTVVGVDGSSLIVSGGGGTEYRVAVDEATLQRLRSARSPHNGPRVSPKEIQARIRAGLSAEEVAAVTGASVDTVQRFEGPVLAEREYILNTALAVTTQSSVETEDGQTSSAFGAVIRSRLNSLDATTRRWVAWKDESGSWVIKVEFTANEIDHYAHWSFEPRKHALTPLNSDAGSLSQKGDLSSGLIPRLRAVDRGNPPTIAAEFAEPSITKLESETDNVFSLIAEARVARDAAVETPAGSSEGHSPTADLLEALRKRRTERESTPAWLRESVTIEESVEFVENDLGEVMGAVTLNIDETIEFTEPFLRDSIKDASPVSDSAPSSNDSGRVSRNTRPVMPSWDEIVFGTRSDEDPS